MAAVVSTRVGHRIPVGDRFIQTVSFTTLADSATEWVAKGSLGFSTIDQVVSSAVLNTTYLTAPGATYTAAEQAILDDARPVQFQLNAQGTGASVGTSHGDLGVRSGRVALLQVTVLGR